MTNPPELDALRYLLDELDADARAAFEQRLETDPAAARALREAQNAVAGFATDVAPAEVMSAADQRRALDRIMSVMEAEPRRRGLVVNWRRWAWPLAAALLLGLNLWQLMRNPASSWFGLRSVETPTQVVAENAEKGLAGETASAETSVVSTDATATASDAAVTGDEAPVQIGAKELRRLREIRLEYEVLAQNHDRLNAEHLEILRQLAAFALTEQGVHRLAAMELVDPESYAAGERKGLLDFALKLLTEPGIVALDPATPTTPDPTQPDDGAGDPAAGDDLGASDTPSSHAGDPDSGDDSTDTGTDGSTQDPYAWSVYDESQQRGFLNLYNLPTPDAGESLQLWVRTADSATYTRVGEVPAQYYGGSGSLSYSVPGMVAPPAEILVTTEPGAAPPAQPTGPAVLRGP